MLTKKDYLLVSIIGFFFGLFSLPILKNIKISGLPITITAGIAIVIFFILFAIAALWISSLIAKKIPVFLQIAKFAATGALNTFIDLGILNILLIAFSVTAGVWYAVFKGISFTVATINSYLWNKYWTFESKANANVKEFGQFLVVSVIGFGVNVASASFIVNVIHPLAGFTPARWANVGALSATIISLVWNFIGYKFIVFKKHENIPANSN